MESGKCGIPFPLHLKGCWRLHVEEAAKAHEEQNGPQGTCVAWCASQVDGVHDISQPSIWYPVTCFHWTLSVSIQGTYIWSIETEVCLAIDIRLVPSECWWLVEYFLTLEVLVLVLCTGAELFHRCSLQLIIIITSMSYNSYIMLYHYILN